MPVSLAPLYTWRTALCTSGLEPTSRHVGLTLSLYMNERGGSAFPGAVRLAADTGLTERTVRDHLAKLVGVGWLEILTRGGGRKNANEYAARFPETGNTERGSGNLDAAKGEADDAKPGSTFPPSIQERSTTSPSRRKRRPSREYEVTDDQNVYALAHGLNVTDERDGWLDWCEANGRTYDSITKGFSTWLRNAVKFGRGGRVVATLEELAEPTTPIEPPSCPLDLCGGSGFVDVPGEKAARPCRCRRMART